MIHGGCFSLLRDGVYPSTTHNTISINLPKNVCSQAGLMRDSESTVGIMSQSVITATIHHSPTIQDKLSTINYDLKHYTAMTTMSSLRNEIEAHIDIASHRKQRIELRSVQRSTSSASSRTSSVTQTCAANLSINEILPFGLNYRFKMRQG